VRRGRSGVCLWKTLVEGVGRGDIWPIGHILLCREHYRLGQLEKELAIPPNPRRVSSSGDWELLAASRGGIRVVNRTLWWYHRHHGDSRRRGLDLEAWSRRRRSNPSLQQGPPQEGRVLRLFFGSSLHPPYGPDSCVRASEPRARASGRLPCRKRYATVRAAAGESVRRQRQRQRGRLGQ
jgi:hypothetical protein